MKTQLSKAYECVSEIFQCLKEKKYYAKGWQGIIVTNSDSPLIEIIWGNEVPNDVDLALDSIDQSICHRSGYDSKNEMTDSNWLYNLEFQHKF